MSDGQKRASYRKIIRDILSGQISDRESLEDAKRSLAQKQGLGRFPRNSEILRHARPGEKKKLAKLLQKKPSRTASGVAVVAAMTRPAECPHGKCRYCPGGPDFDVPQSYTGKEPATRRAIQYGFNPYLQTLFRLKQLHEIGHPVDKVELIVMGGTLTAQTLDYQEWFVKNCLQAMNEFTQNKGAIDDLGAEAFIRQHNSRTRPFDYMQDVQAANEKSDVRCVGITFEPRPDWCRREQIDFMLGFGVTRVELGVQHPDDRVYEQVERGHTVDDVVEATAECKDSALKVGYHMMPGILGVNPEKDMWAFKTIFNDPRFKPDMLKIYPLIVLEGTEYYDNWKAGRFTPITTGQAVDVIVSAKSIMPKWVRTMRVMRDIPSNLVAAGIKSSNLGQLVTERMAEDGVKCKCIRCREAGQRLRQGVKPSADDVELLVEEYDASGGREYFISFEDTLTDTLLGFLRLRRPGKPVRPEITGMSSLVRELHVYGPLVEIGEKPLYEWQHRGYGRELLEKAEELTVDAGLDKICVISGVGVRDYYRKAGYDKDGVYMSKNLH